MTGCNIQASIIQNNIETSIVQKSIDVSKVKNEINSDLLKNEINASIVKNEIKVELQKISDGTIIDVAIFEILHPRNVNYTTMSKKIVRTGWKISKINYWDLPGETTKLFTKNITRDWSWKIEKTVIENEITNKELTRNITRSAWKISQIDFDLS